METKEHVLHPPTPQILGLLEYWVNPRQFIIGSYHGDKGRREFSLHRLGKKYKTVLNIQFASSVSGILRVRLQLDIKKVLNSSSP